MCAKHKKFFTDELLNWKKEIIKANNLGNILNSSDDNVSSAILLIKHHLIPINRRDESFKRSRKLISKINLRYKELKMEHMDFVKKQANQSV